MFLKLLIYTLLYSVAASADNLLKDSVIEDMQNIEITKNDLLLIVGVQKCIRNKATDKKRAEAILPVINKLIEVFEAKGNIGQVIVFHPENHSMFFNNRSKPSNMHDEVYEFVDTSSGRKILSYHLKIPYCIAFTDDASPDFAINTKLWQDSGSALIGDFNIKIGTNSRIPERSAFMDHLLISTRFDEILNSKKINRIFLVGHPLETLVYNTAIDGQKKGFKMLIIMDATVDFRKANLRDLNDIELITSGMIN